MGELNRNRPDAGTEGLSHYEIRLSKWRYRLREKLLPVVRWETPYLAWFQATLRSPALDTYFSTSANLGTHTFYMVMLPILFWCGYTSLARAMVHILGSGVFFSGFLKDLLCLPRPLSPPLQRITMSGSAALEYGFPSSHSTNAVSVALYCLYLLRDESTGFNPNVKLLLQVLSYFYAFSIITGRLYCGMHGFFDVVAGSILGAIITLVECNYGGAFEDYIHSTGPKAVIIVVLITFVLIRIHPEPADDCPCFDDSVSFAAVVIGIEFGTWHFAQTTYAWSEPGPATVPYDFAEMGYLVSFLRILIGVAVIFAWRGVMKPTFLRVLPPIFRVVEALGLNLPRRFFKQASEYRRVPKQRDDDNIIPPVRDIPNLLSNFRRRRGVSIGPQSEADAYETMAYREKKRRESITSNGVLTQVIISPSDEDPTTYFPEPSANTVSHTRKRSKSIEEYRNMMGAPLSPRLKPQSGLGRRGFVSSSAESTAQEMDEKELFSNLQKPRVRYDVEVVTKLIVYSGIAWLAVEGNPILFHVLGLSV
jgi:membrane-associated phospholipid phosphatase